MLKYIKHIHASCTAKNLLRFWIPISLGSRFPFLYQLSMLGVISRVFFFKIPVLVLYLYVFILF